MVFVPEVFIRDLLSNGLRHSTYVTLPEPLGLPTTAHMVGVWPEYSRNAFALVVEDESFEEVPEGSMLPEIPVKWGTVKLAILP